MTRIEELEQRMDEIKTLQKDFEIEINECQKALAELKESKKEGKWKPQLGEDYWFRNDEGSNVCRTYNGYVADTWRYNNVPMFKTQSECQRYWHFMDTVKEKSYEFSKEEWENTLIEKHCIQYKNGEFFTNFWNNTKTLGMIYFKTEEDAKYIIDNFKDELMEFWL